MAWKHEAEQRPDGVIDLEGRRWARGMDAIAGDDVELVMLWIMAGPDRPPESREELEALARAIER